MNAVLLYVNHNGMRQRIGNDEDDRDPQIRRKRLAALTPDNATALAATWSYELSRNQQKLPIAVTANVTGSDQDHFAIVPPAGYSVTTLAALVPQLAEATHGADWDRYLAPLQVIRDLTEAVELEGLDEPEPLEHDCICGKQILDEGTCIHCGHGNPDPITYGLPGGPAHVTAYDCR